MSYTAFSQHGSSVSSKLVVQPPPRQPRVNAGGTETESRSQRKRGARKKREVTPERRAELDRQLARAAARKAARPQQQLTQFSDFLDFDALEQVQRGTALQQDVSNPKTARPGASSSSAASTIRSLAGRSVTGSYLSAARTPTATHATDGPTANAAPRGTAATAQIAAPTYSAAAPRQPARRVIGLGGSGITIGARVPIRQSEPTVSKTPANRNILDSKLQFAPRGKEREHARPSKPTRLAKLRASEKLQRQIYVEVLEPVIAQIAGERSAEDVRDASRRLYRAEQSKLKKLLTSKQPKSHKSMPPDGDEKVAADSIVTVSPAKVVSYAAALHGRSSTPPPHVASGEQPTNDVADEDPPPIAVRELAAELPNTQPTDATPHIPAHLRATHWFNLSLGLLEAQPHVGLCAVQAGNAPPVSSIYASHCRQLFHQRIDDMTVTLLEKLEFFHDRLYQRDPQKASARRRYVSGMKEVAKLLRAERVHAVIVATDIREVGGDSDVGTTQLLTQILASATEQRCLVVYAMKRRELAKVLSKVRHKTSIIGLLDYSGAQELFNPLKAAVAAAQEEYAMLQHDNLLMEAVQRYGLA